MPKTLDRPTRVSAIRLLLSIAPEFAAAPIYLLDQPAHLPCAPCDAYTIRGTDFAIRDELIRTGDWSGPGLVIVLCNWTTTPDLHRLVIHEAAHHLPYTPPRPDQEPTPDQRAREAAQVILWASGGDPLKHARPWEDHGIDFTRACLHLAHRAAREAAAVEIDELCAGWGYGLSPARFYAEDLGDEPQHMHQHSFDEILATPVPGPFIHRWESDTALWKQIHERP